MVHIPKACTESYWSLPVKLKLYLNSHKFPSQNLFDLLDKISNPPFCLPVNQNLKLRILNKLKNHLKTIYLFSITLKPCQGEKKLSSFKPNQFIIE